MAKSAREIAFDCLRAFRRSGTWADQYLKDALAKEPLSRRDAALAAQLVYGVLQNRALIDFYIAAYSSVPFARIEPQVLDILRIGVYQIALLDRIPPHAAVNESVALVRRHAARAAGFFTCAIRRVSWRRWRLMCGRGCACWTPAPRRAGRRFCSPGSLRATGFCRRVTFMSTSLRGCGATRRGYIFPI